MNKLKRKWKEFVLLVRSVPSGVTALFVISVFAMNLLANKSINLPFEWLALDCGILVSWFAFLAMDVITKHFGPKAATELSILAILINLAFCLVFFAASVIPGIWGEADVSGSEDLLNTALNNTFGGNWFVLLGSTIAFVASAVINNFANWGVGKVFADPNSTAAFFVRTYVSTAVAQFADNLIFALIVSHTFFGWSIVQCLTCAACGMLVELVCEVAFSYLGYWISKRWAKENVGAEYFAYLEEEQC